ncbi:MAG: AAA family ATPase [Pseudomonadota bacterium]
MFPRPEDGQPDVTIVFGPNEAGKSTAFEGFLELLFGLKGGEHRYAFGAMKRADLLVGAELDLPGRGPTVLRRNGARTGSLMDENLRPVDELILTAHLHGLNRDAYETRFSLNNETLRKGGAAIAKADGDLGQLLHAGVSGLSGMATALDGIAKRADDFYRKGARGTALKRDKDRLIEIARELRDRRLTPEKDGALRKARDAAETAFRENDEALSMARKRQAAGMAAATWHRISGEIEGLEHKLQRLPDGPDLSPGAADRIVKLDTSIEEKAVRIAELKRSIDGHRETIEDNPPDPAAPSLAIEIAQLEDMEFDGARLLSRADTAKSDLETRIEERDTARRALETAAQGIAAEGAGPDSLVLAATEIDALGEAAQGCIDAARELADAEEKRDAAKEALGEEPERPQDLSVLEDACNAYNKVADLSDVEARLRQVRQQAEASAAGLPEGWRACVAAGLPAEETLSACATALAECVSRIETAEEAISMLEAAHLRATEDRAAREAAPSAIDAAEIEATRSIREASWHAHRSALDAVTADAFEAAMRTDDAARANFMAGADERHQLATARRAEAEAKATWDSERTKLEALKARRDEALATASRLAEALALPRDTEPAAFKARRKDLVAAEADRVARESAAREHAEAEKQRKGALAALRAAADGIVSGDGDLAALVTRALTLRDSVRRDWTAWEGRRKALGSLEADTAGKETARRNAVAELDRLTRALPLADRTAPSVKAALPALRAVARHHDDFQRLDRRVGAMARALETLKAVAGRLAGLLGVAFTEADDPVQIIRNARERVAAAAEVDRTRQSAEAAEKNEAELLEQAEAAVQKAQEEIARAFDGQGGADLPASERVAALKHRDDLRRKMHGLEAKRLDARAAADRALFEEELALLPDDTRTGALETLVGDAQGERDMALGLRQEARRHHDEAYAATDPSALIAEQAILREALRQGARQAAVCRIGDRVAREALRRLAGERRSTMLDDVRDAFVAMTAPAWQNVEAWTHDQGEKLVGTTADGEVVHVERMSSGTMGQLYFALRLAGYRSFVREAGPLPMILDDIMETFDNKRASEALNLCSELGREGQAIMFTHHEHLVELARETVPDVAVLEMHR